MLQARQAAPKVAALKRMATGAAAAAVVLGASVAPAFAADLALGAEVFNGNCGEAFYGLWCIWGEDG